MKETAVEWLTEKLKDEFGFVFSNNILEQAKEIEKEQIIDAWGESRSGLEYYNRKYKK